MNRRTFFCITGLILLLLGVFLPRDWFDALPRAEGDLPWVWHDASTELSADLPLPPVKGVTLLRVSFILEGLAFLWLGWKRWTFKRLSEVSSHLFSLSKCEVETTEKSNCCALWGLAGITLLGLILRSIRLDADLWLDEIAPLLFYSQMPPLEVVTSYISANNHLLNTLLMKLAVYFFGEREWAVRLPAVIFGTATITALYWVSRLVFSQRSSLFAALLLSVSYHHIFFSQNARGYSAYLLFSILSSRLLVMGICQDRALIWILYGLVMILNFASLLNSGFVLAAHILIGAVALIIVYRRGISPIPLLKRLAGVFGTVVFLVFQLYASIIPQVYVYAQKVYSDPATGFSPFSAEFWNELIRGMTAGVGATLIVGIIPAALIALWGFFVLFKKQWMLVLSLALPGILTAAFLMLRNLTFSPRFFLLFLPLGILLGIQGIESVTAFLAGFLKQNKHYYQPRLAAAIVLFGAGASLLSLRHYYSVPKQSYRASLEFIELERGAGEKIIVIHLAEKGYRFYAPRYGLREGVDFFSVRSIQTFDEVLSLHDGLCKYLVVTFPRALRLNYPELDARISRDWVQVKAFPATVGDGEISVWRRR